jgi:hypothetical protein
MSGILYILLILQISLTIKDSGQPLPDLDTFLRNIRAHLRSDRLLQSQYTYNLRQTETWLDKEGNPRKTEVNVYEVYPSLDEEFTYTRRISKDGKPLSAEEIEKQDRNHEKKLRKRERKLKHEGMDEETRRLSREAQERRKEDLIIDEIFRLYEITISGREIIDGRSAIHLVFRPRPDFEPVSKEAKLLAKMAGRAWFCETDHQLMRAEVELIDNLSFGLGLLARLNKGAKAVLTRRLVNNEIWLPAEAHFTGKARLLLLKGIRINTTSEFSDYKKFTVETSVTYRPDRNP